MGVTPVSPLGPPTRVTPEDIVRQLTHLPSAPRVLPKLKRLLSDGNSSLHEVVALVRLDPGIAARVLHVGNSAYFNQGLRCYTVEEAVHRVGYDQIYELVADAVASEVLVRPLEIYYIGADELWQSSVACAVAAEGLAAVAGVDRDIAYTIGLLHRVGLVAINEWVARSLPMLHFKSQSLPLETCEQERRTLGFHNAEAAAALLRLWEFPAVMSEPVRWQYLPAATAAHSQLASLLHVAKWIRTVAIAPETLPPPLEPSTLRSAGVAYQHIPVLVTEVRERLSEISSLLDDLDAEQVRFNFPAGERDIVAMR